MHIYLQLFLTFLKIGAVTFGGGYAMIPLVKEAVLQNGWLTEEMFLNFIAVAESTPGPIAINMATFIGSTQGGLIGSIIATFGVVLPSFLIILFIVAIMNSLIKYKGVQAVLRGIRPVALGLICATGLTMVLSVLFGIENLTSSITVEFRGIIVFAIVAVIYLAYYFKKKKFISPILLIVISAGLGMILYSV
ncbi:MAG: chromate transporter [Clostridia bacterium]|nr:chromate transporter [Clostridia bacterium]